MRVFLLMLALTTRAIAQSIATVAVVDENGVAVSAARVSLQCSSQPALRCQTDFTGRCEFAAVPVGVCQLHVEKPGFYALDQLNLELSSHPILEVVVSHQQEVREIVDVHESPPAIDPAQVSSQESLSGLDVIDLVYPATNDYRNVLNFIPGVVQDQSGQPHVAGAETHQTETLLDGFNVTQPATGQLLVRVSTDAFRNLQVEPAREPAEYGKGPGGTLFLNTGIGDDHFRFYATDFIPSVQDKHGLRFDQFLPRFTFSGPIEKKHIWFYNAFDGEYDNSIYTELPVGQDNDHIFRLGNLTKLQSNLSSRNILTTSFLVNDLHDQYAFLSPQSPQLSNPKDVESAYVAGVKDQHYFSGGELLESGVALDQYNLQLTPYGDSAYFLNPNTATGGYYLNATTHAHRWQGITNLFLPPRIFVGRHDFKVGLDFDRIAYSADFFRQSISFLSAAQSSLPVGETCLNAAQTAQFPCTRYSTFSSAPLHDEFNTEVSAYAEDRWSISNRLLIEPGIRLDWDEIIRRAEFSPRLAGTYVLDNSGNTKLSAGLGLLYESTPVFLVARPYAGSRADTFYTVNANCVPVCVSSTGPVLTSFTAKSSALVAPRSVNSSLSLEKKLPAAIYLKAEVLDRRGARGFVYNTAPNSTGNYILNNTRDDRYDAFQISLRRNFRENYVLMASYTRSRARSNQVLDFSVDNNLLSAQLPGPYPWDTPNRFLSWGYLPLFKLPIVHQWEVAYSLEARTGFPFNEVSDQQQILGRPGDNRFPQYFSANLQLEKRFHFLGYYLALRGGLDNLTGRCNPYVVNGILDSSHPTPTFSACEGRAFTSRIRLLGKR